MVETGTCDGAGRPGSFGPGGRASRLGWACLALGLAISVVLALFSEGAYHDDGLTHYLYARWAWSHPEYLVDAWGRPGQTCLLFPIAWLGWTACRVESAVLSAASVWLAWDIARRLGLRHCAWVPLLCFAQPLFLLASYTTLTETAAAFYLALAIWCLMRDRPIWSAVVVSLCFVTRYEMLVLIPLWAVATWRRGGPRVCYPLLLWAPVVHNLMGLALLDRWPIEFILGAAHPPYYGAGTPLTMVVKSMAASGPAVGVLALVGLLAGWRDRSGWLVPAVYGLYLATHSLIFAFGAYASGGYPRFLVSTSPVAAVCAAAALGAIANEEGRRRRALAALLVVAVAMVVGLEMEKAVIDEAWLFLIDKVRPAVGWAGVVVAGSALWMLLGRGRLPVVMLAAAAVVSSAVPLVYLIRPHAISEQGRDIRSAVAWLRTSAHADAPVVATNIWASRFLDRGYNVVPPDSTSILDGREPGTVFLWDAGYGPHPRFGITPESMQRRDSWELIWTSEERVAGAATVRLYVND